jgi:hypothetical protein
VTQQMQISGNAAAVPCPDGLAAAMVEAARQAKLANGGITMPTLNGPLPAGLTRPANGHSG